METKSSEEKPKNEAEKSDIDNFYEMANRMYLAGLGALDLSYEKAKKTMDKLVERGELARKDREKMMKEMHQRHKKFFQDREGHMHKRVEEFFNEMNEPTKTELDELNKKLTELEKKIDKLVKAKE